MGTPLNRPVIIAVIGALVVLLAILLAYLTLGGEDEATAPPPETTTSAPTSPAPDGASSPADETAREDGAPSFDVVRIDPQGNTVMAGRAKPGSQVVIRDRDEVIGQAQADARGEWVFLPDQPLPPGPRELSLEATAPDGTTDTSQDVVVLVVPEHTGEPTLALRTGREGGQSRLLQGGAMVEDGALTIDTVDYDEDGYLSAGGRAQPDAIVQLYLDNAFLGRTTVGTEGFWSISPEEPAPFGDHTLRADLVNEAGQVLARVEMPFSRVENVAMPDGVRVVIQPGNNLWRLARQAYGAGTAYTVIYDANKGQIVNPDLIYPGQVFVIPDSAERR